MFCLAILKEWRNSSRRSSCAELGDDHICTSQPTFVFSLTQSYSSLGWIWIRSLFLSLIQFLIWSGNLGTQRAICKLYSQISEKAKDVLLCRAAKWHTKAGMCRETHVCATSQTGARVRRGAGGVYEKTISKDKKEICFTTTGWLMGIGGGTGWDAWNCKEMSTHKMVLGLNALLLLSFNALLNIYFTYYSSEQLWT